MEELKNCPFCGSKAYLGRTPTFRRDKFIVGCTNHENCGVAPCTWPCDTEEEAINNWNHRSTILT